MALARTALYAPGDTLYLLGGRYRGTFFSILRGSAAKPIIVRNAPGQRATIDGGLFIRGGFTWYWGLEVMFSDTRRTSALSTSTGLDLPRAAVGISVEGPNIRLINNVFHDLGNTVFGGLAAPNFEMYGTLVYNNGWIAPNRGHGHGVYLQNASGSTKRVVDNVLFQQFSTGIKISGTSSASLQDMLIEGNTSFANGAPAAHVFGMEMNAFHQGGDGRSRNLVFRGNSFYHADGTAGSFKSGMGSIRPVEDMTFSDNIVQGVTAFNIPTRLRASGNRFTSGDKVLMNGQSLIEVSIPRGLPFADNTLNGNRYSIQGPERTPLYTSSPVPMNMTFAAWRRLTSYDAAGSLNVGKFDGSTVIVRPNQYESGRAFVTVWNWNRAASVNADLSRVLRAGDRYQVHHVYDVYGAPVASGTYNGTPVALPQTAPPAPMPIGWNRLTGTAGNDFNVYLVRRVP